MKMFCQNVNCDFEYEDNPACSAINHCPKCGGSHFGNMKPVPVCGQIGRDRVLLNAVENASIVYYGPHSCDLCGQGPIVRGSVEQGYGALRFEYPPENIVYPNHNWAEHQCRFPEGYSSGANAACTEEDRR